LDAFINVLNPKWGAARMAWRLQLRGYDAGDFRRLNAGWSAVNQPAEQTNAPQRDLVRARARDLERNSDIALGIIRPEVRNVVGQGFRLQSLITKADGTTQDEALNTKIEQAWEEWCLPRNCDVSGQQSFWEMIGMAVRRRRVDGGVLFVKCYTDGGPVPFSLQLREVDDMDTSSYFTAPGTGNTVIGGIELDSYNRPVAYYLKETSPDGYATGKSTRVEAQRIIFWWDKTRPSQVREFSPLAPTLPRVRDIQEYMEAVGVGKRIQACLALFVSPANPAAAGLGRAGATTPRTDASSGYANQTITPGMIYYGNPDDKVEAIQPSISNGEEGRFVGLQQRLAATAQGLAYETASGDLSQTNYSSIRAGRVEEELEFGMTQGSLAVHVLREVYTEFVISGMLAGAWALPGFWREKRRYLAHKYYAPGRPWVDPEKEATGNKVAMATGQTTLAAVCAAQGLDWRENLEQRAKEIEYAQGLAATLGVPVEMLLAIDNKGSVVASAAPSAGQKAN
jgi:lambda family phage portal protein